MIHVQKSMATQNVSIYWLKKKKTVEIDSVHESTKI